MAVNVYIFKPPQTGCRDENRVIIFRLLYFIIFKFNKQSIEIHNYLRFDYI